MINTCDFKTKNCCIDRKNEMVDGYWGMAIDIGYSGVKGFSPNKVFCFPAYARKTDQEVLSIGNVNNDCIQYRDDETKAVWVVGASAIEMLDVSDTRDSVNAVFGRNRYFSEMFLVIARTSIAIGMMDNEYGNSKGKKLVIQTGLPPAYLRSDTPLIKEALAGTHKFSIKIGNSKWINYDFTLAENSIWIMPQPMGSLVSVSSNSDGSHIPEAAQYFNKKMLIFDPGFGTLDIFNINRGRIDSYETFDDLGMKRVMIETTNTIFEYYHTEIPVLALQKFLDEGTIRCFDRKAHKATKRPFGEILEKKSKEVCQEALARIDNIYNNFIDHDFFVVTGGTGEAWYPYIKEYFKDMDTLHIIPGNQNDNLPYVFSNVRGYYLFLLTNLRHSKAINDQKA